MRGRIGRGLSIIYIVVTMVAATGLVSLAVDYGRVQMAKTELRRAADAGARAAATALGSTSTAQSLAVQFAGANTCDGQAVQLDVANDIEFGTWDSTTRTFTVYTGTNQANADAVRVTARRLASRGNALPLYLAGAVGQKTCDAQGSCIATIVTGGFGLVGINFISLKGNTTASYWSSTGATGGNAGDIASNGNISSTGTSYISGTVWHRPQTTVTGVTANRVRILPQPLSFANGDASPYTKNNNDNGLITPSNTVSNVPDFNAGAGKTVSVPGGHYFFHNFSASSTATVNFLGPAVVYYYGTFNLGAQTSTNGNLPKNLTFVAVPDPNTGASPGALTISGAGNLYATIYAPQSDITLSGSGNIYGSLIGKSITMSGSADIYYDLAIASQSAVQTVK